MQGITTILTTIGSSGMSRLNSASIYVRLTDMDQRVFSLGRLWRETWAGQPRAAFAGNFSQREKMQEIRGRLSKYPDLRIAVRNQTSLRQGAPVDIDFAITGPDLEQLAQFSEALRQRFEPATLPGARSSGGSGKQGAAATPLERIPGIVDTDTTLRLNKPELLVEIDRERAASLGVDVEEIAQTLRVAIGGDDRVSRYRDPALDDVYDVELRLVGFDRESQEDISQLYVRSAIAARNPQYERQQRSGCRAVNRHRADAIGQRGPFPHRQERRSHRSAGSPAHGRFPSEHRPRLRLGRSHRGRTPSGRGTGNAGQLQHAGARDAAANSNARCATSPGRLSCRSSSCTSCWPPSSSTSSIR